MNFSAPGQTTYLGPAEEIISQIFWFQGGQSLPTKGIVIKPDVEMVRSSVIYSPSDEY
jgi:hypothetical protein